MDEPAAGREGPVDPPPREPASVGDIPISDRWAPLVRSPDHTATRPPALGRRLLAAVSSLIVLVFFLWAIG